MVNRLIFHRTRCQPHRDDCHGCAMPRSRKAASDTGIDTIQVKQDSMGKAKRKITSSYATENDLNSTTQQVIEKHDRLDHNYVPEDEDEPAAKKPKPSRQQDDPVKIYSQGTYSPPEKSKTQSRKDWASIHCKRTLKLLPEPRKASATGLASLYEQSRALNIFMQGEYVYQSTVATDLRKKRAEEQKSARVKIEELEMVVGALEPGQRSSKKQKAEVKPPLPTQTVQHNATEQSRYESIRNNLANELGTLKLQLEEERHDKIIEEQAKQSAQRLLEDARSQIKQLTETSEEPLAALRVELNQHKQEREHAEKQLKEALSDRSRAESEILVLKEEKAQSINNARREYRNRCLKAENESSELKAQVEKLKRTMSIKEKNLKEELAAKQNTIAKQEVELGTQKAAFANAMVHFSKPSGM